MDDVGGNLKDDIRELMKTEGRPRLVFDNFDFKILANIILPNHRNSNIHIDRIPCDNLDDSKPLVSDIKLFENKEYLLDEEELKKMKSDFTILVTRILVQFLECLRPVKNEVITHIPHM